PRRGHDVRHAPQPVHPRDRVPDVRRARGHYAHGCQGAVRAPSRTRLRRGVRRTMRTVQPSIMIGSYSWDQDRLPRDEFQLRMAELNRVMDAKGLKAVLVHGDAAEHSALAYFSNFIPRLRWGMALLPREGEPRLLISMSSRDV